MLEQISSIYFANLFGLPLPPGCDSDCSSNSPFNSIFGGMGSGNMGSGNMGFGNPFGSLFGSSFGNSFGSSSTPSFDFGFNNQFNIFPNLNFMGLFKNNCASSTRVKEINVNLKTKNVGMKLSKECRAQIAQIEKELNFEPHSLQKVIYAESGGNPKARNPISGATGLIQFMPKTARGLGTTTSKLYKMTAEEQMVYVRKYMKDSKRNAGYSHSEKLSSGEVYGLVFMPGRIKNNNGYKKGSTEYSQNRGLDVNNNGIINEYDLRKVVDSIRIKSKT
jgi:hypothetical protein